MKTSQHREVTPVKGIDIREPQGAGVASVLSNATFNPETQSWSNDVGYERYFPNQTTFTPFPAGRVDSLYNFEKHNGAQQWLLFETAGTLYYVDGASQAVRTLATGRTVPGNGEPGSYYNVFGKYVCITNGIDSPLKYRGYKNVMPLGWPQAPSAPGIWRIAPVWSGTANDAHRASIPATENYLIAATSVQATTFDSSDQSGLGSTTDGDKNKFRWKVSWINEAGSESPISSESDSSIWTTAADSLGNFNTQCVFLNNIPTGPAGTVGRRIYRTKNMYDTTDGIYYFVDYIPNNYQTSYVDNKSDDQLGSQAPDDIDSIVFPASKCRFSATYKGCLFVDGGQSDGTKLFYSEALQPDTFRATGGFNVGTRKGGDITGLYTFNNQLLVFRDSAIDIVRGDAVNGFTLVPWTQGIGTRSAFTITDIPGAGIVFLGNDGVYNIGGASGLDGGATLKIEKISDSIGNVIEKKSGDLAGKACAVYSSKWKEWHCYFPAYGTGDRVQGIVLHVPSGYWSTREGFDVSCITTDFSGNVIFGNIARNGSTVPTPPFISFQREWGLFVVSKRRAMGTLWTAAGLVATLIDNTPASFMWRSQWHDFGAEAIKKAVKYVYVYALSRGNNKISLNYFADHSWENMTAHPDQEWQWDDRRNQPVFGTVAGTYDEHVAIIGTDRWQDKTVTPIRFDISNKYLTDFAFEIATQEQVEFIGYSVEFEANGTTMIGGKR